MKAKESYVLDVTGPVGTAILQAPTILSFEAAVKGRAAHAGFEPEKGIHAIQTAARAIAALKLGHVDEETTLNVGLISGGSVVNAVPELCTCRGEIRSYSHEKALALMDQLTRTFENEAEEVGAAVEVTPDIRLIAYDIPKDAPVVTHFKEACEKLGLAGTLTETFGGSDNNNFVLHGIQGIVLSSGMYEAHSVKEYTYVQDMISGAELVAELLA